MRTVDPEIWSKNIRKAPLNLARPMRFGKRPPEGDSTARSSFHDAAREYWRNCSVNGVRYIADESKPAFFRYTYAFILFLLICFGVFNVSIHENQRASSEPSTVSQRAGRSTGDAPFPAVGLCSNNIVSTRALHHYAATLVASRQFDQNDSHSEAAIARNLAQLGHLLTMSLPQEPPDAGFMNYLHVLDPRVRVASLMFKFAPNCTSLLVRCSWRGRSQPCHELFQTRITPLGFCCVFNSRYQPEDVYKLPQFLDVIGEEYGLSVVVKQDIDDVSFFRRSSYDIDVLIFDGSDYPLLEGGGARLYPAEANASVYLSLSASLHYSEEGFDQDIETLRCRSRRAAGAGPASRRSHAWCLAECRRRTLDALCECRLHTLPPAPRDAARPWHEECSLTHLACMNKHREKLVYYYPRGPVLLEQELQNAQDCRHCTPDCARLVYSAAQYTLNKLFPDPLLEGLSPENVTTIRLYYASKHLNSFVFQSNSRWYEKFVMVGSGWALVVGASVVSACELAFHCSLRWRHHYLRRRTTATIEPHVCEPITFT